MMKRSIRVVFIETKELFNINDIDVNKVFVSKKRFYGKKKLI